MINHKNINTIGRLKQHGTRWLCTY